MNIMLIGSKKGGLYLEDIRDCRGRLICKAEPSIGFIESSYKRQNTKMQLPIGGIITFERDGVRTTIKRQNSTNLDVESKEVAM